jgi:hypothetical protein
MKAMTEVIEVDGFINPTDVDKLLLVARSATEEQWNLFNETELNGLFWDGKRLMIDAELTKELANKLSNMFDGQYQVTAANKLQRFYTGRGLGPLTDSLHVPSIKYGAIFFLHDGLEGEGIEFPQINKSITPKANKLVVYPADLDPPHHLSYGYVLPYSYRTLYTPRNHSKKGYCLRNNHPPIQIAWWPICRQIDLTLGGSAG